MMNCTNHFGIFRIHPIAATRSAPLNPLESYRCCNPVKANAFPT